MNKLILISLILNIFLASPCVSWLLSKRISDSMLATSIKETPRLKEYFELGMKCVFASCNDMLFVGANSRSRFDIVHFRQVYDQESFLVSWNGDDSCCNGNKIFIAPDIMLAFLYQKDGSRSLYLRYNNNEPLQIHGNVLCVGRKQSQDLLPGDNE